MRNRQKEIIFLGQVSFFIVMEARTEMGKGETLVGPVSHADFLLGVRSYSGLCKHSHRNIVAIESPEN